MVGRCANPSCGNSFKYLGEGRLFIEDPRAALQLTQQQLFERCYWLCAQCASNYRINFARGNVELVPLVSRKAANF